MTKPRKAPGPAPAARRKAAKPQPETEDLRSDWRTPPAQPRKNVRKYTASAPARSAGAESKGARRPERAGVTLPSRQTVLRWLRFTALGLVVAALAFGMVQLLHRPELAVQRNSAQIGGAERIPPLRIYESAGVEGRNIFLVRSADVEARVVALPGIAGATVHLRLPNQVIIDVIEHAPLVAWQGITTTVWLAEDGAEVPQAGDRPPLTLVDESEASLEASQRLWPITLKSLTELHAVRPDIRELFYGRIEGLYYRTPEGTAIWLGDSGSIASKISLVTEAQREIAGREKRPEVIDVRLSGRRALYR